MYKMETDFFSMAYCDRIKDNGFKDGSFRLDTRIKLFVMLVVKHWSRLPREVVDVSSLKIFNQGPTGQVSVLLDIIEDVTVYCIAYYMTCKCSFQTELIYDSRVLWFYDIIYLLFH